jgi:hypothetical protein
MGQWLIADVSVLDVHVQLWMLGGGRSSDLARRRLGDAVGSALLELP